MRAIARGTRRAAAIFGAIASALGGVAPFSSGSAMAQAGSGIEGAWVGHTTVCDDVYSFKAGKPVFKAPVNIFAPAIIITGKQFITPQAACSPKGARPVGDRVALTLQCANLVGYADVKVSLAKRPDGKLARFYNENDVSGSLYALCPAK